MLRLVEAWAAVTVSTSLPQVLTEGALFGVAHVAGLPVIGARRREAHRARGRDLAGAHRDRAPACHEVAAGVVRIDAVGDRPPGAGRVGPAQGGRVADRGARRHAEGRPRRAPTREGVVRLVEAGSTVTVSTSLPQVLTEAALFGCVAHVAGLPVIGARRREAHRARGGTLPALTVTVPPEVTESLQVLFDRCCR